MMTLGLFTLLSTALYYLGTRAMITRFLWSRYSPGFERFMDCPACTGFWWGALLSLTIGDVLDPVFVREQIIAPHVYGVALEAVLVGLCMLVLTPLCAGLMQHALLVNGSTVQDDG